MFSDKIKAKFSNVRFGIKFSIIRIIEKNWLYAIIAVL